MAKMPYEFVNAIIQDQFTDDDEKYARLNGELLRCNAHIRDCMQFKQWLAMKMLQRGRKPMIEMRWKNDRA